MIDTTHTTRIFTETVSVTYADSVRRAVERFTEEMNRKLRQNPGAELVGMNHELATLDGWGPDKVNVLILSAFIKFPV